MEKVEQPTEAVMFVPYTPGGELAKALQEADDSLTKRFGCGRVRMVEETGRTLISLLQDKDPWGKGVSCGREDCLPCQGEVKNRGKCGGESVTYVIKCPECEDMDISAEYQGESALTGYLRGRSHLDAMRRMEEKNPLVKHTLNHH